MKAGRVLTNIYRAVGFTHTPACKCRDIALKMDSRGVDWCRARAGAISDMIIETSLEQGWRFARWTFTRPLLHLAALATVHVAILIAQLTEPRND